MSTGMRKWMEKDCPEIEYPPAQVLIDREELKQLLDRLEATEEDRSNFLVEMGKLCAQCDALRAKIEAAEKSDAESIAMYRRARDERDELRGKIEAMEKQEPVVEVQWAAGIPNSFLDFISTDGYLPKLGDKLYALPGAQAQPAPSVPDGWKEGVESAARLIDQKAELYAIRFGRDDIGGLSFGQGPHAEIKMDHYTSMIELADEVRATLAAAPKPEGE